VFNRIIKLDETSFLKEGKDEIEYWCDGVHVRNLTPFESLLVGAAKKDKFDDWVLVTDRLPEPNPRRQIIVTNDTGSWLEVVDSGWFAERIANCRLMKFPEFNKFWREIPLPHFYKDKKDDESKKTFE
jgi:hypothetical protein